MAENKLGIGQIPFPQSLGFEAVLALEDFVRKVDGNINYLLKPNIVTVTADYTATDLDSTILCNGNLTVTLPQASTVNGKKITIKNIGTGTVTVDGFSSETIDGSATDTLSTQYDGMTLHSNGTAWFKISTK